MKKLATISLLSLVGVALLATGALANYGEDNKLSGYVRQYDTKKGIKKAKVKLYKKSGSLKDTDKTRPNGKYSFKDLEEGTYKVKAKADGYRNPKDAKRNSVNKTVKVDGNDKKNLYLKKI